MPAQRYLPLHGLWSKYVSHLLEGAGPMTAGDRIIKADFHGAFVTVARARSPSMVGLEGIVLQETENVFRIVTPDNALKTVPKAGTVFALRHGKYAVRINGSHIRWKASERAVRKFKAKPTSGI